MSLMYNDLTTDVKRVKEIREYIQPLRVFEITYIPAGDFEGAKVLIHDKRFNNSIQYPFYGFLSDLMDNGIYWLSLMDIEVSGKGENINDSKCYLFSKDFQTQIT